MDPAILSAGAFGLASLGILYYISRNVSPVTSFLYANARIQARSNYIIQEKNLDNLASAKTLGSLINLLRETDYIDELEKLQNKEDVKAFHKAVEKSFLESLMELKKMSPDKAKGILDAYLGFYEARVLKTIFRARQGNEDVDEEIVFPVGIITPNLLRHLLDTKTVADMGVVMSATKYGYIFLEKYTDAEHFDVAIEDFVLKNLISKVKKAKMHDSKAVLDLIMTKVDILNLLALLKFKVRGIELEKQKRLLVMTETELGQRRNELINAESIKKMVELCKNLKYYGVLEKSLADYEKDNSLLHFEQNLMKYYRDYAAGNEIAHSLGPYPLFSYIIKKEIEMRNLFVISSGIANGFNPERIKRLAI